MSSGPSNLMAMKMESKAKEEEEKGRIRRKKGAIVLMHHFMMENGFLQSMTVLERESGIGSSKLQAADNISLLQIIQDYEEYFDHRFGHKPKLFRSNTSAGLPTDNFNGEKEHTRRRLQRVASAEKPLALANINKSSRPRASLTPPSEPSNVLDLCPVTTHVTPLPKSSSKTLKNKTDSEDEQEGGAAFASNQRLMKKPFVQNGGIDLTGDMKELSLIIQRDILDADPNVRWTDIAALEDAKQLLKEAVVMPTKYPQFFKGRLRPWKGVLLFGPPGTGKTMLAKAVATECNTTFFNISASSIVSKWRGDSEKLIRMLFDMARHYSPSTIFLDELDSIMSQRTSSGQEHEGSRRMKTELMIQMDGLLKEDVDSRVFVLGASNTPWDLDDAILRRLEKRILVGMPTEAARISMFKSNLDGHIDPAAIDFLSLATRTEGYTGSDINVLCREAMMRTVRVKMRKLEACDGDTEALSKELLSLDNVTMSDLGQALKATKSATHAMPVAKYLQWNDGHGSNQSGY